MTESLPRWQLEPPSPAAKVFLLALVLLLPLGVTAGGLWHAFEAGEAFPFVAGSRSATAWVVVGGVAIVMLPLWWWLQRVAARHRIRLEPGTLGIETTFHRRTLAFHELDLDHARVVDLDERTELRPMLKSNGTALPGLKSGWFRLRNREKALVATAGGSRVLWLPTRNGYGLLLQPRNAQALLDELRALAASGTGR